VFGSDTVRDGSGGAMRNCGRVNNRDAQNEHASVQDTEDVALAGGESGSAGMEGLLCIWGQVGSDGVSGGMAKRGAVASEGVAAPQRQRAPHLQ
jgi:hypothetical protein